MKQILYAATFIAASFSTTMYADGIPLKLRIAYYSNSEFKSHPGTFCEGKTNDIAMRGKASSLKKFDDGSLDPKDPKAMPKFVALHRQWNALGCTLKFTSGPLAGHTALVADYSPDPKTVAFPLNTSDAYGPVECQRMIQSGYWIKNSPPVTFELAGPCKGAKMHGSTEGTTPAAR